VDALPASASHVDLPLGSSAQSSFATHQISYDEYAFCFVFQMFSHRDVMHCAVNSYVLWSFAPYMINNLLGNEQFWAVYLAGGMFASLASTINQTLTSKFHPSLGASGAIYTLVALLTMAAPHTKINLFFVLPLELWQGMSAMVLFDIIGLFFYKRFPLDHAAHLGGAAFGLWFGFFSHHFNTFNHKCMFEILFLTYRYALIGAKWWRERDSVRATLEAS
jgi:membrane associated rhomboid family serine protease